jgi:hypothetical protein
VTPSWHRDSSLRSDDASLLRECDVDCRTSRGPGGQKRNKTSSAVRLRHQPTGLAVIAEESRSQSQNKSRAVRRLRLAIALSVRQPASAKPLDVATPPSTRRPEFAAWIASLLDVFSAHDGRMSDCAGHLGCTTAQLAKLLSREGAVLAEANRIRAAAGLRPIKPT